MLIRVVLNNNKAQGNYTYSDFLDHFLAMVLKYLEPEQIEVFYVPPINRAHVEKLKEKGHIVNVRKEHPLTYITKYAFKLYLYEDPLPDELVICDADTWCFADPDKLVKNTRGYASRVSQASYRQPKNQGMINWKTYREALNYIGCTWNPPILCNGHQVFKDKERTDLYRKYLKLYLHLIHSGEIEPFMPQRYKLFMANNLAVYTVYPREDIWFCGPEEIGIERYEYAYGRSIFMDRQRLP